SAGFPITETTPRGPFSSREHPQREHNSLGQVLFWSPRPVSLAEQGCRVGKEKRKRGEAVGAEQEKPLLHVPNFSPPIILQRGSSRAFLRGSPTKPPLPTLVLFTLAPTPPDKWPPSPRSDSTSLVHLPNHLFRTANGGVSALVTGPHIFCRYTACPFSVSSKVSILRPETIALFLLNASIIQLPHHGGKQLTTRAGQAENWNNSLPVRRGRAIDTPRDQ
ncbi:hypothetical protein LLEC1_06024, partial [Akanthomyces lecanii]